MKIAILARGESLVKFPGNDKFDEVWGLNKLAESHQLDRLYLMDDLKLRVPFYEGEEWAEWLKTYKGRIITSKVYEEWPCEAFPIVEVAHHFGLPLGIAMYSTVDYMLAAGIYEEVDEIHLYGVDCPYKAVTDVVRQSIATWIGAALSRGIKVTTPYESAFQWSTHVGLIHEQGLYGYVARPRIEDLVRA